MSGRLMRSLTFPGHAQDSLKYLVEWADPEDGGPARLELTVLGHRSAFYVSKNAAVKIDEYTTDYALALQNRVDAVAGDPTADPHVIDDIEDKRKSQTQQLRDEVGVDQ